MSRNPGWWVLVLMAGSAWGQQPEAKPLADPVFRGRKLKPKTPKGQGCHLQKRAPGSGMVCFTTEGERRYTTAQWFGEEDGVADPKGALAVAGGAIDAAWKLWPESHLGPKPTAPQKTFACTVDGRVAECAHYESKELTRKPESAAELTTISGLAAYAVIDGKWVAATCESTLTNKGLPHPCDLVIGKAGLK
jgi:hypothetical protein